MPVFMHPYKISANLMPRFTPNVPFPVEILLVDHYGNPVSNGQYAEITVSYEGLHFLNETELVERFDERFDKYGIASFILRPPTNANRLRIRVRNVNFINQPFSMMIADAIESKFQFNCVLIHSIFYPGR